MLRLHDNRLKFATSVTNAPICKILGGRFNYKDREWHFPPLCMVYNGIRKAFPDMEVDESAKIFEADAGFVLSHRLYDTRLLPYQRQAVDFLVSSPHHGSLLALSPGLGKTFTSIYAAGALGAKNILVVAPLTLIPTWQREIKKWSNADASVTRGAYIPFSGWQVTNYENVVRNADSFIKQPVDLLIVDESIMVKNRKAKRSEILQKVAQSARKVWLLSGSPISKHADDLYMQLAIIEPSYFTSYWRFTNRYCVVDDTIWGSKVVGTRPDQDIRNDFRDLMFSRDQKEVLPELPEMLFESYECTLNPEQQKLYTAMEKDFILELEEGDITASTRLAQLTRLQQIVSCPDVFAPGVKSSKQGMLFELIERETLPMPAIIWGTFHQTINRLVSELRTQFPDLVVHGVSGETKAEDRASILAEFQSGKVDLLVLSLGVGKYGLTLTTAKSAVYYDRSFDADAYVQSLSRIHRLGLDHKPVIFTLTATRTTDKLIDLNLSGKMESIHKVSNADLSKLLGGLSKGDL